MRELNQYDKLLFIEKKIDGSKVIKRRSPFNAQRDYDIFEIKNEYLGSFRWIIDKLNSMDTQRFNIVQKTINNNLKIREEKSDDRMSRDLADFILKGGESIIN